MVDEYVEPPEFHQAVSAVLTDGYFVFHAEMLPHGILKVTKGAATPRKSRAGPLIRPKARRRRHSSPLASVYIADGETRGDADSASRHPRFMRIPQISAGLEPASPAVVTAST